MELRTFYKEFNKLDRVVQIILLLIPVCNWVVEMLVRWTKYLDKKDNFSLLVAICFTIVGLIPLVGWADLICLALYNHLLFGEN